jgi:hypothetical protein
MPWLEAAPVDERLQVIAAARRRRYSMTDLCAR